MSSTHFIYTDQETLKKEVCSMNDVQKRNLRALFVEDFLTLELPPRELILTPWLPKAGLAMIHSAPGIGKTHLALGVCFAVASGTEFLGWKAPKPRGVLYIDGEMPAVSLQERISRLIISNGDSSINNKMLKIVTPDVVDDPMPDLGTVQGQEEINLLLEENTELLIVDNLSCLVRSGKENEAEGWRPVQSWALSLRGRGISVLFIHHDGKGGSQRGSSKKLDVLDSVLHLKHSEDYIPNQGANFNIFFEKSRGFYGPEAAPFAASLIEGPDGKSVWVTRTLEESNFDKTVSLFNEGTSQHDIAKELNLNKSTVSRHIQKAKNMNLITRPFQGGAYDAQS